MTLASFLSFAIGLLPLSSSEVFDYCELFECEVGPWSAGDCTDTRGIKTCCVVDECWQLEKLKFCCHPNGICVLTSALGNCDPDDYLVICEWGMSLIDGTIACFD